VEAGKRREQLPRRAARLGLREAPVRLRAQVLGKLAAVHTFEDENGAIALRYKLEQRHGSQVQRRSEAAVHGGLVLGLLRVEFCVPRASCLAATMLHHLDGDLASIRSVRQVDRAEAAAPQPVDELVTRYRVFVPALHARPHDVGRHRRRRERRPPDLRVERRDGRRAS